MPTARELLEQADALMRRNRQEAARGARQLEGLKPVAPGPPADLRTSPRVEPGSRSRARVADPGMGGAASRTTPAIQTREEDDADIPVLDDAVVAKTPSASERDDVPVLTDAVDEIEVAAPAIDEGEASDWLTMPPGDDESVLGPAPPSIALVPPASLMHPATATPRAAWPSRTPLDEEFEHDFSAPDKKAPVPEIEDLPHTPYEDADPEVTVRRVAPALGAPIPATPARATSRMPEIEDLTEAGMADLDPDVTWTRPMMRAPASRAAEPVAPPAADAATSIVAGIDQPPEPAEVEAVPMPPPPSVGSARAAPTGADFDALAEEIRMQVLQRIDLFTDTGLRDRLGERLKPIVDRASADLVATINQHLGELLRAYVAEAIEREIEHWRAGR